MPGATLNCQGVGNCHGQDGSHQPDHINTWGRACLCLKIQVQTLSASSWVTPHIKYLSKTLPDINKWISKADTMLEGYKSWNTYCQGFTLSNIKEGNFAVARHYHLEVTKTEDRADSWSFETPIAHRTRARMKGLAADMHLETPSKSTNISKTLDIDDFYDILTAPGNTIPETLTQKTPTLKTPSPFQEKSPIPKELENAVYPPMKDEQIVNCALVIFLNALTISFSLVNNWTLHRKVFKAEFEDTSYEARTDGYLDDY
ncbi:hypothetical protein EMCG_05143 [[Emmonsia] crescens]|uniref:Uncharacterized protein n=1 Tax=[Emmonsia] crescens TaxID=73230 RepID=A0A0G2HQ48_9EURO|nr:hypothetical protein EMCG_05143 [Emmonsia crescens UAMH 3008]